MTLTRDQVVAAQTLLKHLGLYAGRIDGDAGRMTAAAVTSFQRAHGLVADGRIGPLTWAAMFPHVDGGSAGGLVSYEMLRAIAPAGDAALQSAIVAPLNRWLPEAGITAGNRLVMFLGQTAEESDGFKTLREYWGPTPAQLRYEGRADLGNTVPGDGHRFMGRGLIETTGRANYAAESAYFGVDFLAHPELLEQPEWGVRTAIRYWTRRGINALADAGDIKAVTRAVNGGTRGLAVRQIYTDRARAALIFAPPAATPQPAATPIATSPGTPPAAPPGPLARLLGWLHPSPADPGN